jgi:hypothetical protein
MRERDNKKGEQMNHLQKGMETTAASPRRETMCVASCVVGVGGKITNYGGRGKILCLSETLPNAFSLYSCTREAKDTFAFPNCVLLLDLA